MILKVTLLMELKPAGIMSFIKDIIIKDVVGKLVLENELVKVSVNEIEEV
jgi:hypothetical protein